MFLYFRKGDKGKLISKINGKTALIHSGNLLKPGLAEVEIVEEASRYVLVYVLNEAAMLEMQESSEERSKRLTTARRLFGEYHVRTVSRKADETMVTFYWRGMNQEMFDTQLQAELRRRQPPIPRRRWTK